MFIQRRSVAKSVGCFQRRLFVCLFVNTITSERVNIGLWSLGKAYCTKISAEFEFGGHSPWVCTPWQKCSVGLRRWENQCRLSSLSLKWKSKEKMDVSLVVLGTGSLLVVVCWVVDTRLMDGESDDDDDAPTRRVKWHESEEDWFVHLEVAKYIVTLCLKKVPTV